MKEITLLPEVVELQPPQACVTSLENLGITTRRDRLNLSAQVMRLIKFDDPRLGYVYFAGLDYPLLGSHLADFLNVVAPFKNQDLSGMKADLQMPLDAARETSPKDNSLMLHKAHLEDKKIGGIYRNYYENHAQAWNDAAQNSGQDSFFNSYEPDNVQFVDIDIYTQHIAQRLQASYAIRPRNIVETAGRVNRGNSFAHFLSQDGTPIGRRALSKLIKGINYDGKFSYDGMTMEDLARRARSFLQTLSFEDQKKAALDYATKIKNQLLIDPVARKCFDSGFLNRRMDIYFRQDRLIYTKPIYGGSQTIEVGDLDATTGVYSTNVRSIHFPDRVREEGLYPALVWKNNGRGPELLGQKSFYTVLERVGLPFQKHWDTLLGVAMAAYFSPGITGEWERELTLDAFPGVKQPMKAAQMALWPSVPENRSQLVKKAAIFQKVERAFEK